MCWCSRLTGEWAKIPRPFSTRSACRESLSPITSGNRFCFMTTTLSLSLGGMPYANRAAEGSPNHLFGASSPAFVKAGIFNQDGQVVAAPVVATVRAGGTACDVFPADLPHRPYVLQNAEF